MARKKRKGGFIAGMAHDIKEETIHAVVAILFFVVSIFLFLGAAGEAGLVGNKTYDGLSFLLGVGYYLIPLLFLFLGIALLSSRERSFGAARGIGAALFFISGLGLIETGFDAQGGVIGGLISSPLVRLFDFTATLLILCAALAISLLVIFDARPSFAPLARLAARFRRTREDTDEENGEDIEVEEFDTEEEELEEDVEEEEDEVEEKPSAIKKAFSFKKDSGNDEITVHDPLGGAYVYPPLSLLEKDRGKPGVGDIKANANLIKRTLLNFGIQVEMDEISIGPSVTRYALKPAEGVRLSKIVGLQNNLELALAAHPVRIEAPIPGKSLVGIELPNTAKATLGLGTLFATDEFAKSPKSLLVALGRDITGMPHFADLAKMPHLLIAGATGSGKSVTIHSIITSLLFRNSPEKMRMMLIDPKRVELTLYNKIPHLLTPVITDAKKAILALKWAAKEMDRRYDILEAEAVRDIDSYHKNILEGRKKKDEDETGPEAMPYIVIIIDELADIMQTYPRELEAAIVRLAQMSRAVGIHLILSTQRPSVNVITGLIKANIPARIALQVASQIDSRTILDTGGAEKLLGAGDMLYLSGEMSKPRRIQAAFISEGEVKKTVKFLSENFEYIAPGEVDLTAGKDSTIFSASLEDDADDDELYEEAREIVIHAGKASTSYLQRKLRIGYARAARLMDILEEKGVIGPADGAKPREVLEGIDDDSYEEDV